MRNWLSLLGCVVLLLGVGAWGARRLAGTFCTLGQTSSCQLASN